MSDPAAPGDLRADRPSGLVQFCPKCGSRLIHTVVAEEPMEFVHCHQCGAAAEVNWYVEDED
jgi:DNA-directed RNA polymerase subunit M/transcription elongation factor TFIIS